MSSPIPALPDAERRTPYSPVASAGPFDVGFAIYADSADYSSWIEVWLDDVKLTPVTHWVLTSPSGTLANLSRPITDAQVTLPLPRTGNLQIVSAQRPRRTAQLTEGRGLSARDTNRIATEEKAIARDFYDRAPRIPIVPPGDSIGLLPVLADRSNGGAGSVAGYDGSGNPIVLDDAAASQVPISDKEFALKPDIASPSIYTIPHWFLDYGVPWTAGGSTGGVKPGQGDVAADTAALKNLIFDMSAAGGTIIIPKTAETNGLWFVNDPIYVSGRRSFNLRGLGPGLSCIKRMSGGANDTGAFEGMAIGSFLKVELDTALTTTGKQCSLKGFSLIKGQGLGGDAIEVFAPANVPWLGSNLNIEDVDIVGINNASALV